MNREVNLTKRVTTEEGERRFFPVEFANNGRVKPDVVLVDGEAKRYSNGRYYLDWRQNGKRIRLCVGTDAASAGAALLKKTSELNAINNGLEIVSLQKKGDKRSLAEAVQKYLHDLELNGNKPSTFRAYEKALEYFSESCHKLYLEDVNRDDMLSFSKFLRDKKQADRTVYNKFLRVIIFLKAFGVEKIVGKKDWPRYTEEMPEIYEQEELDKFFSVCDEAEKTLFEFFLRTGLREQEVQYVYWSDIDFQSNKIKVTHKADRNWKPKMYKERAIPMHEKLSLVLSVWKKKADLKCDLVFPTKGCRPCVHFLDFCNAIAERAGLDSDNFWLHKFRATFATRALRSGVDVVTVQKWLGHSDIQSTMRYLRPSENQEAQDKMNAIA